MFCLSYLDSLLDERQVAVQLLLIRCCFHAVVPTRPQLGRNPVLKLLHRWRMTRDSLIYCFYVKENNVCVCIYIYIYIYIYNFVSWVECSPGWVIPKTQKIALDISLLNTQRNIRYVSKVKWSNQGKEEAPSPIPLCCSSWKGSRQVALDYGRQLNLLIYTL